MEQQLCDYEKLTAELQQHIERELAGVNRLKYLFRLSDEVLAGVRSLRIKYINNYIGLKSNPNEYEQYSEVEFFNTTCTYFSAFDKDKDNPKSRTLISHDFEQFTRGLKESDGIHLTPDENVLIVDLLEGFDFYIDDTE